MNEILDKQEAFKRLVLNSDFQYLVHEMNAMAENAKQKQLDCHPLKQSEEAMSYKLLRTVLEETIPLRIQSFINYQEDAPDKQVEPKKQWKFSDFLDQIKQMFQNSPPVA